MPSLLPALAALLACSHATFPGPTTSCPSTDGTHVVSWAEPSSNLDEHHLFLRDVGVGRERELLLFPRHVKIFWSPSGTRLAVTNAWASDESTVLLWADLAAPPVNLLDELAAQEGQQVVGWDTHHLYLEAKGWTADGKLRLRLWGYGDPPQALDRRYIYTLGKGFSRE
jgi:hypothetical protein